MCEVSLADNTWLIIEGDLNRREIWPRLIHYMLSALTSHHKHWLENCFQLVPHHNSSDWRQMYIEPNPTHTHRVLYDWSDTTWAMFVLMSHRLNLDPWGPIIWYTPTKTQVCRQYTNRHVTVMLKCWCEFEPSSLLFCSPFWEALKFTLMMSRGQLAMNLDILISFRRASICLAVRWFTKATWDFWNVNLVKCLMSSAHVSALNGKCGQEMSATCL